MQKIRRNKADWEIKIENECKLRGFSDKTIKAYVFHIQKYLNSEKTPKEYLLELINNGKSNGTIRSVGFAIKFYLKINKTNDLLKIPNVKKERKLPIILSKEEINKMIISPKNVSHRLIIQIGYATGMRASEISNLKWENIDFQRNTIHIKQAKNKKDRLVMLSPKVKKELKKLTNKKEGYVFITNRGKKYNIRTIEKIVSTAAKKTDIKKQITPHTLRHSFATHLLESGVDIKHIQKLLGHSDIKTTLIYTKVSNRDLIKIKSPIDT